MKGTKDDGDVGADGGDNEDDYDKDGDVAAVGDDD